MSQLNNFYTDVNIFFESTNIDFMNHGYYPTSNLIKNKKETFKNQKSLYLSLFDNIIIKDKNILEIGCGRGGGIKTLNQYFNFKEVYACDLNEKNIDYCKNNSPKNINFKVLDAINLDYPDQYFDIIVNVESSHCYSSPEMFFLNVKKILKPDGIFLYADCGQTIQSFSNFLHLFKNIIRKDITENVRDSCFYDIKNFNYLNIKKEVKDWLSFTSANKFNEYSLKNNQYIQYICFDDGQWINV